jgi:hypothetical protein
VGALPYRVSDVKLLPVLNGAQVRRGAELCRKLDPEVNKNTNTFIIPS